MKKTCQRVFQALRIDVNQEFEVLYEFMEKLPGALKPGGRAAILTFHSGEDKLVKAALKEGYRAGIYEEYSKDVVRRPRKNVCGTTGSFYKNALGSTGRGVISESDHPVDQAKDPGGKDSIEDDRTCDCKDFRTNTEDLSFFFIFQWQTKRFRLQSR